MTREKTLIPNKQIELMFFRVASDEEVEKYVELAEGGLRHRRRPDASNKVYHMFMELVDLAEAIGALPLPPTTVPQPQAVQPPLIIGGPSTRAIATVSAASCGSCPAAALPAPNPILSRKSVCMPANMHTSLRIYRLSTLSMPPVSRCRRAGAFLRLAPAINAHSPRCYIRTVN